MIEKKLTIYCDECALSAGLVSSTLKEASVEALNRKWTNPVGKKWLCPNCSLEAIAKEQGE